MRPLFLAATSALLIAGCAIDDPDTGSTVQAIGTQNRLASNRLASNRLASNRLASNRLASNKLSTTQLVANPLTAQILNDEAGRDVYSYIVSCALPAGTTIQADIPTAADTSPPDTAYTCANGHCTFAGNLALAPTWADQKLDPKGQNWVSACLFSRVNANDIAEAISLRGTNPGLAVSQDEAELYVMEEGAFFGNLFTNDPNPNAKPDWHACRGAGKAACSGDVGCGGLGNRDCAAEDPAKPGYTYCGFQYAGDCRDFTPAVPSAYSCRAWDPVTGIYGDCSEKPYMKVVEKGCAKKYREVITTWVAN